MLNAIGRWGRCWAAQIDPWTNVYGLARSLLALGTLLTLVFSRTSSLFRPAVGVGQVPMCSGLRHLGAFCVLPNPANKLELVRWLAVGVLVVVASGWRPRIMGVLHWWISLSLQINAMMVDGGDQATMVLTMLLVPVTLTDGRHWHWEAPRQRPWSPGEERMRLLALVALFLVRLQVAGIYFHAAVAKHAVTEWADGTVLYYWLTDPYLGTSGWRLYLLRPLLIHGTVAVLTWGVLALEFALIGGLVVARPYRRVLLVLGLLLHGGILVMQGLVSFGCAMFAALILYLHPVEQPLKMVGDRMRVLNRLRALYRA